MIFSHWLGTEHTLYFACQGKLVVPEDSAAKLLKLLIDDKYESGSHIDFFDPDL